MKMRVLAIFLAFCLLIAQLPITALATGELTGEGKVEALLAGGKVEGNTVTYGAGTTVEFTPDGNDEGRSPNHWWVGMKVTAPEGASANATYRKLMPWPNSNWSEATLWSENSDGTFWGFADQKYIDYYGGESKSLTYTYQFDWDGDGAYDQTVTMTVKDGITLIHSNHVWDEGVETTPSTCTDAGVRTFTCACGETKTEAIPATGHTLVDDAAVAPTCTEPGKEAGKHCEKCDYTEGGAVIPATGHTLVDDAAVAPTCTEPGKEAGKHCEKCDYTEGGAVIPALGHDFSDGACIVCGEKDPEYKPTEPVPPVEFTDVEEKAWYYDAVEYAVTNGLMNGIGHGKFDPEGTMTRAMLVTVLWRYEGKPMGYQNTFVDVNAKSGSWYIDAVAWAAANNIVGGIGDGKFDPEGKITREQMATILFRYANWKGIDTSKRGDLNTFPDGSKTASWAKEAMQWTVAEKIIGGSDGKLLPQGSATRAQVATILMRFIENIVKA